MDSNKTRSRGIMLALSITGRDRFEAVMHIASAHDLLRITSEHSDILVICAACDEGITAGELASLVKEMNSIGKRSRSRVWFFTYGAGMQVSPAIDGDIPAEEQDATIVEDRKRGLPTDLSPIIRMLIMDWSSKSLCHVACLVPEVVLFEKRKPRD